MRRNKIDKLLSFQQNQIKINKQKRNNARVAALFILNNMELWRLQTKTPTTNVFGLVWRSTTKKATFLATIHRHSINLTVNMTKMEIFLSRIDNTTVETRKKNQIKLYSLFPEIKTIEF